MIDYLFPIFCFGVLITGIVVKGLLTAIEMNDSEMGKSAAAPEGTPISRKLLALLSKPQERRSPDLVRHPEPQNPVN
jgi:hypothetical protein